MQNSSQPNPNYDLTVLIIDDDEDDLHIFKNALNFIDLTVDFKTASNGPDD